MLPRIRTRLGTALVAGPLALSAAVPVALAMDDSPRGPADRGLVSQALGPGDGLDRYVVTVGRDLPPVSGSGWRQSSSSETPTYDENLAALEGFPGVEIVQPLGDNRALVAVEEGTSARVLPFVRSAEPAPTGTWAAATAPTDPLFAESWHLRNTGHQQVLLSGQVAGADVDALTAWEHSRGEGVVVAVIDNGVDSRHPDLGGSLWTNPDEGCDPNVDRDGNGRRGDCHGWNFYRNSPDVTNVIDGRSMADHGTPVASTIAAGIGNGIGTAGLAPQAKVMPVVIGGGYELQTALVAPAIRYAVDNGADILNMSFGISGDVPVIRDAIAYAASKGVLMVAAAGNSGGLNRDVDKTWPVSYGFPELIGVGSSNALDGIAAHSDVGASTVHLFAPGQEVYVALADGGHARYHGTSFASPITAAAAALVMAARPDMSAAAVKDHLVRTVDKLPAMAGKSVSGGRLDAGRAVATLAGPAQVSVDGLAAMRAKTAGTATVRVTGTGEGLPAGELALKVSLAAYKDGKVLAVADHAIDAGTAGAGQTGQDGSLLLSPPGLTAAAITDGVAARLTTTLPQGRYGLVTQLLSSTGAAVTPPQAVGFTVLPQSAGETAAEDGTSGDAGTGPAPGDEVAPGDGEVPAGAGTPDSGTPDSGSPDDPSGTGDLPIIGEQPVTDDGARPGDGGAFDPATGLVPGEDGGSDVPSTPGDSPTSDGPTGDSPTSDGPTTDGPTTDGPTTDGPTTDGPTTDGPTSDGPTSDGPTSDGPTTDGPTTDGPTIDGAPRECTDGSTVTTTENFGITSLAPSCGGLSGGDTVTIRGTNLPAEPTVLIGGEPARVLSVNAPTSITVSTPRRYNTGTFDVQVFNLQRESDVLVGAFTYYDDQDSSTGDGNTGDGSTGDGSTGDGSTGDGSTGDGSSGGDTGGSTGGGTDSSTGDGSSGGDTGGSTGEDGSTGSAPTNPVSDPDDFEGLTLVDTGGNVGGLTVEGLALMGNCGTSCFATKL